jgi:hypothetical protein
VNEFVDLLERHGGELVGVIQDRAEDALRDLAERLADRARRELRGHH